MFKNYKCNNYFIWNSQNITFIVFVTYLRKNYIELINAFLTAKILFT